MTDTRVTGVTALAPLDGGHAELEAAFRQGTGAIICDISWPERHDDRFEEIASRFRHQKKTQQSGTQRTHMTLRLPADVQILEATYAWLRKEFNMLEFPPPLWTLHTQRGESIYARQHKADLTRIIFTKEGEEDWYLGEPEVEAFMVGMIGSGLCRIGTVMYIEGRLEVNLTQAALEQHGSIECIKQLAAYYR